MNRVFKFFLIPLFLLLEGCTNPPPVIDPRDDGTGPIERPLPKQEALFKKAYEKHGSSGSCLESKDCKKICDTIYRHRATKALCVNELPVKQVELLEEVYVILKEPLRKDLDEINSDDLQVFLGIAVEPATALINRMSQAEARETLTWLAKNKTSAGIFKNWDKRFKILKAVLRKIHQDPDRALSAPIYKGDNFIEISVEKRNDRTVDWVHDFFDEDCGTVNNYTECMFKEHYCNLDLNSRTESSYFEYDPFLELLEHTLDDARPPSAPPWWNERVDIDNLDSWLDEPHNVCNAAEFE